MNLGIQSIVLIRHAPSTANLDPTEYLRTPDHAIPLADPEADPAAILAGRRVAELGLLPEQVCAWSSSYLRCAQTRQIVLRTAFGAAADQVGLRESFLLREQEFGDWDGLTEEEMMARDPARFEKRRWMADLFGRFYFRFPNGESRADVVQRLSIFIAKIHRSRYQHHLVFLHGVTQRAFRMAWHNRSPEWFEQEPNPGNASVLRIHRPTVGGPWVETRLDGPPPQRA